MRKITIHKPGSYERLELQECPEPVPDAGEVRVRCAAVGVNYADCIVRMGLYESAKKYVGWPITPGFEFSGTVDAVGTGVQSFAVGQTVVGLTRFGGYASSICVPEDQLFPLPKGFELTQAAGMPVVFLTAWYALCELCRLRPGAKVLVHSAAGGVGGAALQIIRALGCESVGVVGAAHKVAAAKELGATQVIDKSAEPLWERAEAYAPAGYHAVLDPNGAETLTQSYRHLAPAGRLIVYGFATMMSRGRGTPNWLRLAVQYLRTPRFHPIRMTNENRGVVAFNLSYLFEQTSVLKEAMAELYGWMEAGHIRPLPVQEFPLEQAAEAQRHLESGQTVGKLVLVP